jgi:hypothetical protein
LVAGERSAHGGEESSQLRALRAAAQLLHRPPAAPGDIVGRLLAVQAQDGRAARLALRARGVGFDSAAVDSALTTERSLVVSWLCRGTLHLVRAEDYAWLLALTAPPRFTPSARRLGQLGVTPDAADRGVAVIAGALADEGPLGRAALAERLARAGIPTAGQATPHLLGLAALRGETVLGPMAGGEQRFALARDWLGRGGPVDRDAARAELARRYLAGHGPATARDLAAWAGIPLRDARAGLAAIRPVELGNGLLDAAPREAPGPVAPRLLGAFDPYVLGWQDRSFAVDPAHARIVHPGGGILRAVATVQGEVRGTWRLRDGRVTVEPFAGERDRWRAEAADVEQYLVGTA